MRHRTRPSGTRAPIVQPPGRQPASSVHRRLLHALCGAMCMLAVGFIALRPVADAATDAAAITPGTSQQWQQLSHALSSLTSKPGAKQLSATSETPLFSGLAQQLTPALASNASFGSKAPRTNQDDVPQSEKVVIHAMDKRDNGDQERVLGMGWQVYSKPPLPDPFGLNSIRLSLEGMDDMVLYKGYPLEKHITTTGDGYRLTAFRIPYGASGPNGPAKPGSGAARQPVLLIHGISLASTCWVVNQPDESLGFILADQGYDVWMMNCRGNTFSREHEKYTTMNPQFWQFSMDQLAIEDLPAVLQYITMTTKASKIHMVGHSQGGTIALAMLARMPETSARVGVLVALAPVVYCKYMESPTLTAFCIQANMTALPDALPPQEFLFMGRSTQTLFLNGVCQTPAAVQVCVAATEAMFGTSTHISTLQYRRYWQAWPSATSYWNALQWSQMYNEPQPHFFGFRYGQEYDLSSVRSPVVLVSAGRDVLSTKRDIALVGKHLKEAGMLAGTSYIEDYSHMDFIWDINARSRVYGVVMNSLERFTE